MNAIHQLYLSAGLITEDGYVKVRDELWVKSGPYKRQSWHYIDKSILPTKDELIEIYLNLQELIQTQESCGIPSLKQIRDDRLPLAWSSTENNNRTAWVLNARDGKRINFDKYGDDWVIPVRRSL